MSTRPATFLDKKRRPRKNQWAWAGRIGIFLFSFFVTVAVLTVEKELSFRKQEFVIGEPAPRTFFSPLALTYVNEQATQLLRQQKSQEVPLVLMLQPKVSQDIRAKVEAFFTLIHEAKEIQALDQKFEKQRLPFQVSDDSLRFLFEVPSLEEVRRHVELFMEQNLKPGIIEDQKKLELSQAKVGGVTVLDPENKSEKRMPFKDLWTLNAVRDSAARILKGLIPKDERMRNSVLEIFYALIAPNLVFDEAETEKRRLAAGESVVPIEEEIKKDELIAQRGMLVTAEEKARLDLVQKKLAKKKALSKLLAVALLVFLTYLLGFLYLFWFEKKTLLSFRMVFLIHTVFLLSVFLCKLIAVWPSSSAYLMPLALAPLLLTLLMDWRFGVLSSVVMAVLAAPLAEFSADVIVATLVSSAAGVFAALRVRKRIQFLKVGLSIGLSYFLILFAFQMFLEYPVRDSFFLSLQGFASGFLFTTPLAFLLLPLFESLFNLTTDITLLEVSDLNHPLLKRMVVEAPGTYHHSLVVSTLAESACQAIGANALLARVGAYFHDIGKIARAEYFTENQTPQTSSLHEKLTPTMSCLLIMNHVKDGLDLGRRYKLKERILRFIPEHQGTGVIYFFYKRALDQARPGERISADDFRYPGPKPQSKETAVVLLADSTEAASRSLKDPSPESIRQLVRKIINDKFIDGQLDDCNLTLRDLHKIQESFIHNLMAIFHTRVRYPVIPETPDRPDLFEEDQFSKFRINS